MGERESNWLGAWQLAKVNPPHVIDPVFIVTQNYVGWKDLQLVKAGSLIAGCLWTYPMEF